MPKEIVPDFPLKFVLSEGLILWKCESEIKIFSRRIKDALCVSPISARMYEKIYADKPANELANAEAEILSLMKGQLPLVDYMKYRSQIQAIWSLQAKAYR
jgi:hypothetical protein